MEVGSSDVAWREYDIHDEDDDEENAAGGFFLQPESEFEVVEFPISGTQSVVKLSCQDDYAQSTGMSIWKGSEILSGYLALNAEIVRGKSILELGAGVGLAGLTAYRLGATQLLLTDGDEKVLKNLRENVQRNKLGPPEVQCPQLIWGKNLEGFRSRFGESQVLLGTDLFYMTKSLDPLFKTVRDLMTRDGVFIAVNSCASQSPISAVLDVADKNSFTWSCTETQHNEITPSVTNNDEDERIFIFTRK